MKIKLFFSLVVILVIAIVYKVWFGSGLLSGGDANFYFPSMYQNFPLYPYSWGWNYANGLGGFVAPLYFFFFSANTPLFFGAIFSLPWDILERLGYYFPFLIISAASSYILLRKLSLSFLSRLLGMSLFMTNTYVLMLVGGGQIFLGLAYAIAPAVIAIAIQTLRQPTWYFSIILGVFFSVSLGFDLRFFYITLVAVGILYALYVAIFRNIRAASALFLYFFIIPGAVTTLLHFYWLLPIFLTHENPVVQLGNAYTSSQSVQFFSFAKFEDVFGLLHPNWPENIFGKVGFMKPEFLLLPIFAFSSFFFLKKERKENFFVLFFALLGLLSVFLAKGTQDPFGNIYLWMFMHVPGFIMFRDPTKWYLLVAICYSVLVPFSIENIYKWFQIQKKFSIFNFSFNPEFFNGTLKSGVHLSIKSQICNFQNIFLLFIFCYLLFLLQPALQGKLTGTFQSSSIPYEYITLENYLLSQKSFSRTFWIPQTQQYGFDSPQHPEISAQDFYDVTNTRAVLTHLKTPAAKKILQEASVGFVIVPYDSQRTLFLKNRKYDNAQYVQAIQVLQKISWLHQIPGFGRIAVFAVKNPKGHFWISNVTDALFYTENNPTSYTIPIYNGKKGENLVFAESYDSHWVAKAANAFISPVPYKNRYTSFLLPQSGNYTVTLVYTPQKFMDIGLIISCISLICIAVLLLIFRKSSAYKSMIK